MAEQQHKPKKRKPREAWGAVRERPKGVFQASYVGPDEKRYYAPVTFDTMTDARAWLAEKRTAIATDKWTSPAARRAAHETFGDYAERWIAERELRPRTREEYSRLLAGSLQGFAARKIVSIKSSDVRTWYAAQTASGRKTQAARAYGLFRTIMTTAVRDRGIPITENPVYVEKAQTAKTGKAVEPPTALELDLIVAALPHRYQAMTLIAAWGGLRYGELTELRGKDVIRLEDYYIVNVSRAVTHTSDGYQVGPTKSSAGVRSVALPHHITPAIEAYLSGVGPELLLFPARDGVTHLAQSTMTKSFYPARAAAGRPDMPFHALRHYGATKFAQTGATLREIQARLGHSTVAAAMKYQHATTRDAELARRMADL